MQGCLTQGTVATSYKAKSFFVAFLAVFIGAFVLTADRAVAATPAGTAIFNTSAASYEDANNNALAALSNTLATTVQNAPTMTVSAPAPHSVTAGMVVVDTFVLTNTGNAVGSFSLPSEASFTGTASGTTLIGYVLAGASSGSCSVASPCNSTTLALQGGMQAIAATTGAVTVGVEYSVSGSATLSQTIVTALLATVSYASASIGGASPAPPEISANTTASTAPTDTLATDARLDVKAASVVNSVGSTITWTVTANNGGGYAAQGLAAAKNLLSGASDSGIVMFMQMPSFPAGTTFLALSAEPSAPTLLGASGSSAAVYYNAASCSTPQTSGWTVTYSAAAQCIAVYVSNATASSVLPSVPSGSSGAGSVSATPQIAFTFTTAQPSGTGSGNANAVTLVVSSAIGGSSWATGAVPILGQGLVVGASTDAATATLLNAIQSNVTPSVGTTAPGGASNQAGATSTLAYSLLNGPYGAADATGWYPGASGTPSADNMHDFTALNVPCTSNSNAGVNGLSCAVSSTGVIIVNEVKNTGPSSDSITITTTAPSGYAVQLFNVIGACSGGGGSVPVCTQGSALSGATTVASNAEFDYEAVYTATGNSAAPFTPYTTKLTATGTGDSNDTYNVLYPGGVVQLTNGVIATTTNCPPGESAPPSGLACPGGTLTYTVQYANMVPEAVALNLGTEPSFASNPCFTKAGTLMIADDGAGGPPGAVTSNNWATTTNGIEAAATDSVPGGGTNTVFTYYSSGGTPMTTFPGATKLTAQVGGAGYQLAPGVIGAITFTAIVK